MNFKHIFSQHFLNHNFHSILKTNTLNAATEWPLIFINLAFVDLEMLENQIQTIKILNGQISPFFLWCLKKFQKVFWPLSRKRSK